MNLKLMVNHQTPPDPKDGAFIQIKHVKFVTLYNAILDTYGIFKTDSDWSQYAGPLGPLDQQPLEKVGVSPQVATLKVLSD